MTRRELMLAAAGPATAWCAFHLLASFSALLQNASFLVNQLPVLLATGIALPLLRHRGVQPSWRLAWMMAAIGFGAELLRQLILMVGAVAPRDGFEWALLLFGIPLVSLLGGVVGLGGYGVYRLAMRVASP